jgi:phage tail-like protein
MAFGKLEITYSNGHTALIELTKRQMVLGRASDADVSVNDHLVSRRHALLLCGPEGIRIVDTGSANGTYLSGARLPPQQPIPLPAGAELRVGTTVITYTPQSSQAKASEAPPASEPAAEPREAEVAYDTYVKVSEPAAAPTASITDTRPPEFRPPPSEPPPAGGTVASGEPVPNTPPPGVPADRSTYLKYLPAVYSADEFLGRFLLIFEHVLSPIERTVANIPYYFDARIAPPEMLTWLASWLGLVLDERWPEAQRRALIRSAVELYQWRGTRRGLAEFLRLYTGFTPEIVEAGANGKAAAASDAFRFIVRVRVPDPAQVDRTVLETIIDAEKPAHAGYALEISAAEG